MVMDDVTATMCKNRVRKVRKNVKVMYDWKPHMCLNCYVSRHNTQSFPKNIRLENKEKKRAFKFFNFVADKEEFLHLVKSLWEENMDGCQIDVSDAEIKEDMFLIDGNKAHGPSDFSYLFFKRAWNIVGEDVCKVVKEYFVTGKLLTEINSTMITLVENRKDFEYHFGCRSMKLTHVCFADDLLMFRHGDMNSVNVLKEAIEYFRAYSGLIPNYIKSIIIFRSMNNAEKQNIHGNIPFKVERLPVKYLGVPLTSKRIGDVLNRMGCDGEIDDMLRIRLHEAGSDEEIFTSKIIKFRLGGHAHSLTLLEFARRLGLYQAVKLEEEGFNVYFEGGMRSDEHFNAQGVLTEDAVRSLSALIYCKDLDTTTLRDLIDSKGKLILEDPQPGVPRDGIPRPLRVSMQDLYDRMGRMDIRQEAIERMEYRQSYHWDMYQGVFEHMAGVYSVSLQGAYNPPGYAQP
nr:RNA-directed DNA polymerase, eukaryota, reverse transcriptase zinc-binding domain protein [Tanacetum cinerariifolium]